MRSVLKILLTVILVLAVIVSGYVIYAYATYYRLDDYLDLSVTNDQPAVASPDQTYTMVSYNVGFGAYSPEYTFFMDGGKYSRALSRDAVEKNLSGALKTIQDQSPSFVMMQEVDTDSDRSYHVDEAAEAYLAFPAYSCVFAQNYDSPYLFWPLLHPHGKSKSGIVTMAAFDITSALRRKLPIETGFSKFYDLDRCYSVSYIPVDNGKTLCLYNIHLSAYTTNSSTSQGQLSLLFSDMQKDYQQGNYVICGGDFNKDLLGDSEAVFGVPSSGQSWSQRFPFDIIPEGFTLVSTLNVNDPVPSCRDAGVSYDRATSFQIICDGFIVSDNVTVNTAQVIDTQFAYSDHNPVQMQFVLNK